MTTSQSKAQLLIGEVEYHEDKEKEDQSLVLAKSLGLSEHEMPRLLLFPRGTPEEHHKYNASLHGSLDEFVLAHDVALEGLVPQMLSKANTFWRAIPHEQATRLQHLHETAEKFEGRTRMEALMFVRVLKHAVVEGGGSRWVEKEMRRIRSLMRSQITDAKKRELAGRITAITYVKHKMEIQNELPGFGTPVGERVEERVGHRAAEGAARREL